MRLPYSKSASSINSQRGLYTFNANTTDPSKEYYFRAYLIYKDGNGTKQEPVYSNIKCVSFNNLTGRNEFWTDIYVYFIQKHAKDTNETLFKSVNIPTSLETLAGLNVDVDIKSAAIQAEGFATIVEAWEQLHTMLGQNP